MCDMDGGPEAMSRDAGNKSQTRARGVDERSEPCRARPNAEFADRGQEFDLTCECLTTRLSRRKCGLVVD
jgi:hypothetical protein